MFYLAKPSGGPLITVAEKIIMQVKLGDAPSKYSPFEEGTTTVM